MSPSLKIALRHHPHLLWLDIEAHRDLVGATAGAREAPRGLVVGIADAQLGRGEELHHPHHRVALGQLPLQVGLVVKLDGRTVAAPQPYPVGKQHESVQVKTARPATVVLQQKRGLQLHMLAERQHHPRRKVVVRLLHREEDDLPALLGHVLGDQVVHRKTGVPAVVRKEHPRPGIGKDAALYPHRDPAVIAVDRLEKVPVYRVLHHPHAQPKGKPGTRIAAAHLQPVGIAGIARKRVLRTQLVGGQLEGQPNVAFVGDRVHRQRGALGGALDPRPLVPVEAVQVQLLFVARIGGVDVHPVEHVLAILGVLLGNRPSPKGQ